MEGWRVVADAQVDRLGWLGFAGGKMKFGCRELLGEEREPAWAGVGRPPDHAQQVISV